MTPNVEPITEDKHPAHSGKSAHDSPPRVRPHELRGAYPDLIALNRFSYAVDGSPHAEFLLRELYPVVPIRLISVVRAAAQPEIVETVLSAFAPRAQMRILKPSRLIAAVIVFADEAAAPLITLPHLPLDLDLGRDGTARSHRLAARRARGLSAGRAHGLAMWRGLAARRARCAWPLGHGGLLPQGLGQEQLERPFDDHRGIAVRNLVGQQVLQLTQLIMSPLVEGNLELIAARGQRLWVWSAPGPNFRGRLRCRRPLRLCGMSRASALCGGYWVLATDVDERLLERAKIAEYSAGTLRDLPQDWRDEAFAKHSGSFVLHDRFRTPVELRCQDVRQTMPDDKFHLILCRNLVCTYFDETLQQQTLGRVAQRLLPSGALVVGRHEALAEGTSFQPWHRGQDIYCTANSV